MHWKIKLDYMVTDDPMPGSPIERTIEYVAPFDRCDREQNYETARKFFEGKVGEELTSEITNREEDKK